MPKNSDRTSNDITITHGKLIKYYQNLMMRNRINDENAAYTKGENYGIISERRQLDPDNRIPIPLAKTAITNIIGYAGRPGQIETDYKLIEMDGEDGVNDDGNGDDEITDYIKRLDKYNKEGLENSELMSTSLSLGCAWELWWTSDELKLPNGLMTPEYKILDNRECYPIYNDSLKPELEAFIRFWKNDNGDEIADIYMPRRSERWVKRRETSMYVRDTTGDNTYPYDRVPVIPFRTSMDNLPVFHAQKPIIDAFDKLVSRTQNEVDRYNALITLFPGNVDKAFIEELVKFSKPFIDDLEQYDPAMWPKYLEKNLSGVQQFYDSQAERLERLFHKTINIPDMSDEQFAGTQSGVAIAYKLIGFEFLISEIEVYFRQGLEARKELYFDIFDASTLNINRDDYKEVINWQRNLPVDDEAKVRIAAMLMGLGVSREAILKFLPGSIIEDIESELEKEEAQREIEMKEFADNTNSMDDDDEDE